MIFFPQDLGNLNMSFLTSRKRHDPLANANFLSNALKTRMILY